MILVLHIAVALSSVVCSSLGFFIPSKFKLVATYILIGLTLISGTFLVITTHAPVLQSCVSGLVYVSIVSAGTLAMRRKLANRQA
jgi:hypothetical protein